PRYGPAASHLRWRKRHSVQARGTGGVLGAALRVPVGAADCAAVMAGFCAVSCAFIDVLLGASSLLGDMRGGLGWFCGEVDDCCPACIGPARKRLGCCGML